MAIKVYPLNNVLYSADDAMLMQLPVTSGVFGQNGNFDVTTNGNMTVTVSKGLAYFRIDTAKGFIVYMDTAQTATIQTAPTANPRIDRIVLRWRASNNDVILTVLKGTTAENPSAPAISRTPDVYDIVLYDVRVDKGVTQIKDYAITDQRLNDSVCGIMANHAYKIDSSDWQSRITALIEAQGTQIQTAIDDRIEQVVENREIFPEYGVDYYNAEDTHSLAQGIIAEMSDIEDTTPYMFRPTANGTAVGEGLSLKQITGLTLAVNQLVGTNTSSVTITSDHKYYANIDGTVSIAQSDGTAVAVTGGTDKIVDLTQLFGSAAIADYVYSLETANAGAGVAWLKAHNIPLDIPYTTPTLMSVKTSGHKTVGFNQWDEEWELGGIDTSTGAKDSTTNKIRSKNHIPVISNTAYYAKKPSGISFFVYFYDGDKNYISYINATGTNEIFTTPSNCAYILFRLETGYGTTYNNDICINLSWSGTRNGEYEAYVKHEYPLDSSVELRGILKLDSNNDIYADGDTYEADGTVTRNYTQIDLGTLNWTAKTSPTFGDYFYASISTTLFERVGAFTSPYPWICSKYPISAKTATLFVDKTIAADGGANSVSQIQIKDSSYSTAADLKEALNGVYLIGRSATPTTETADPFQQAQVVDSDGTEEWIDERTIQIPVGHDSKYSEPNG